MAWLDFIKAIRQDEDDEKKRDQQGGVKNSVFGFLDDVLDTGDRAVGREPDAKVRQMQADRKAAEEQEAKNNEAYDTFVGFNLDEGKNKTIFGMDVSGAVDAIGGSGKTYGVKTGRKFDAKKSDFIEEFGNLDSEFRDKYVSDLKKLAEEGDDTAMHTLNTLGESGALKGDIMDFIEGSNEKLYGGLTRGALRTTDWVLPGTNTFGLEKYADETERPESATEAGQAGETFGSVQKGIVDTAAMVIPATGATKALEATKWANRLKEGGRAARIASKVAPNLIADVAVATPIQLAQQKGMDQEIDPAKAFGLAVAADLGLPVVGKVIGKGGQMLDDATGNRISKGAADLVNAVRRGATPATASAAADATASGLPSKFPIDDATQAKVTSLIQEADAVPPKEGFVRLYQGNEGAGSPTSWYFKNPEDLAQYFANRSDNVSLRAVDVPASQVTDSPMRPGVVELGADAQPVQVAGNVAVSSQRPAAQTQAAIEAARNRGDDAEVQRLIGELPEDMQAPMRSAMGMETQTRAVVDPITKKITRVPVDAPPNPAAVVPDARVPAMAAEAAPNPSLIQDVAPAQEFTTIAGRPIQTGGQRQRSFYETVQRGDVAAPETKAAVQALDPQTYQMEAQAPIVEAATKRVADDYNGALTYVNDPKAPWDAEKSATLQQLIVKAQNEGRGDDAIALIKKIDEEARGAGRGNAILAAWGRLSPENVLRMAQREVDDAIEASNKGLANKFSGKTGQKAEQLAKKIKNGVEGAAKPDVDKAVQELTVGEKVAKNIQTYMEPAKKKKVDTLVSELTKKIKQEMIAPKPGGVKRTATDVLNEVYKRTDEADSAFPEAQAILRDKFKDNAEVLDELDAFFKQNGIGSPAASTTLDTAIRDTMKANQTKISEVIKKSWDEQITDVSTVAARLTDAIGTTPEQSRIIAEEIGSRLTAQVSAAKKAALDRLMKDTPEKIKRTFEDKVAKLSNLGALDDADYLSLARKQLELPDLDGATANKISGLAQKMQGLPEGPEKAQVLNDIIDTIADTMPPTAREKFSAFRYQNLLSSPRTQLRNVLANTFNTLVTRPATLFTGAAGDTVSSAITGKARERYFKELPKYYQGIFKGFFDAQESAAAAWKGTADVTNLDIIDQFGSGAIDKARMRNLPKKWTVVSRLMEAQDRMFSGMIAGGEYAAQIARGVPEAQAQEAAHKMAEYSLLRQALDPSNATEQGKLLSGIDAASQWLLNGANKMPFGRWIVPFVRTPLNFSKQWLEFSPVGLADAALGKGMSAEKRLEALNKGLLGTSVVGMGAVLAADDRLTWSVPENQTDRDLFYAEGKKPYSVKIGDKWVPLINFGPFGLAMGLPAAVKHNFGDSPESANDNIADKIMATTLDIGEMLSQQTFLSGVGNVLEAVQGGNGAQVEKVLAGLASQTIPLSGLVRYISTAIDPTYREADGFVEEIKKGIPYLSKDLDAQKNSVTGEDVKRNASDYIAPYSVGTPNPDAERQANTEMAAEFYRSIRRGSNERTKTNEEITKALTAGDAAKATQLAADHNRRVVAQLDAFMEKYGAELAKNPELSKRFYDDAVAAFIPLTGRSVKTRLNNQREKQEFSEILSR